MMISDEKKQRRIRNQPKAGTSSGVLGIV